MLKTKGLLSNIIGKVIFVVLAVFVIVYTVFSTGIVKKLDDERFSYRENMAWAVFQIQRQYLDLEHDIEAALGRGGITDDTFDEILLEYEILVSRVNLLREGEGFKVLYLVPEVVALLDQLSDQIEKIDRALDDNEDPRTQIIQIDRFLGELGDRLQNAVVRTTNFVSVYNTNNISGVKKDIQVLSYLFFSGVLVMATLGFFMIRQRQRAYTADIAAQKARQEQEIIEEAADYAKMHALGTLAGGVAHEINTPAQYIQNNLEFLSDSFSDLMGAIEQKEPDGPPILKIDQEKIDFMAEEMPLAIEESLQGLERIAEIVRGIRKFAHPATDAIEQISITEEVDTAITLTRNQFKHVADLDLDVQADINEVNGRRNHLSQALINLIVNASQAIAETGQRRGKIGILVSSDRQNVYIRVRDSGNGIPEDLRDRIFDYFFTTKESGVGTGQGLPICRKLIQDDFNGDLTLSDHYVGGAEFVIRLPKPDQDGATPRPADQDPSDVTSDVFR
ncbi:ATP-binding protein [Thalassospira sp. MA62]|nr:ATP-binding protein [Thalassospira sp. MA62]